MGTTLSASILSMESVMIAGNDEQKRRFFKPMLSAGIGCFALTEPAAGSDTGAGHVDSMRRSVLRVPTKTTREVCLYDGKRAANRLPTGVRQPPNRIGSQPAAFRLENRRRRSTTAQCGQLNCR